MNRIKSLFALIFMGMVLASCQDDADLQAFVAEVNKRPSGQIEPLPEIKIYESYHYSSSALRSPFEPPFSEKSAVNMGKGPEMGREKEPLEAYPLDSLRLVGAIQKKGALWALIVDKSGMVHKLTVGNYIGQNYGKIKKISENKIELIEMVADNQGRWQERPTTMNLLQ
jgi:type IV pilus assembly protein PilP